MFAPWTPGSTPVLSTVTVNVTDLPTPILAVSGVNGQPRHVRRRSGHRHRSAAPRRSPGSPPTTHRWRPSRGRRPGPSSVPGKATVLMVEQSAGETWYRNVVQPGVHEPDRVRTSGCRRCRRWRARPACTGRGSRPGSSCVSAGDGVDDALVPATDVEHILDRVVSETALRDRRPRRPGESVVVARSGRRVEADGCALSPPTFTWHRSPVVLSMREVTGPRRRPSSPGNLSSVALRCVNLVLVKAPDPGRRSRRHRCTRHPRRRSARPPMTRAPRRAASGVTDVAASSFLVRPCTGRARCVPADRSWPRPSSSAASWALACATDVAASGRSSTVRSCCAPTDSAGAAAETPAAVATSLMLTVERRRPGVGDGERQRTWSRPRRRSTRTSLRRSWRYPS